MKKQIYSWKQFDEDINNLIKLIKEKKWFVKAVYGIPRGGLIPAVILSNRLDIRFCDSLLTTSLDRDDILIIDDICDSGKTMIKISNILDYKTASLFTKQTSQFKPNINLNVVENEDTWMVFPWEGEEKDNKRDGTKITG